MNGIYGDMLLAWPEQRRSLTVYSMTPQMNGGWTKDEDSEQTVTGIWQHTRPKSLKDSNGNLVRESGLEFWTETDGLDGMFTQIEDDIYRLQSRQQWDHEGGFSRYELNKVVGNDGTESVDTWWNPQDQAGKPDTWCAYIIRSNQPRTTPFYLDQDTENDVVVEKIATIDLQFVGPQSEEIAQSVAMWPMRSDVAEAFESVNGSIMQSDMTARSSNFFQDGANNVVAWNVTIKVLWYDQVATSQGRMPGVTLKGK